MTRLGCFRLIIASVLLSALVGLTPAAAQGGGYSAVVLTDLLNARGTDAVLAVRSDGVPFVAWREAGSQYGADRVRVRSWDGGTWDEIDTSALLDPQSSQITPRGLAIGFDDDGNLLLALNRSVSDLGVGQFRTLVTRWDGTGWTQLGEPLGGGVSSGATYLLNTRAGTVLVWLENDPPTLLHVSAWNGSVWSVLLDETVEAGNVGATAFAATGDGGPVIGWTTVMPGGEIVPTLMSWRNSDWQTLPALPNQNDITIGVAALSGLAARDDGTVYAATVENVDTAIGFESVFQLAPGDSLWREAGMPPAAEQSDCPQGHSIAAGDDGALYYAWAADCANRLTVTRWVADAGWSAVGDPLEIGNLSADAPPTVLAVAPDGTVYTLWLETTGNINRRIALAAFVPA